MRQSALTLSIFVVLCMPLVTQGADLTGSLLYDGELPATTFDDVVTVMATANASGADQIEGTVDLTTSTFSFSGLETTRYSISMHLLRSDSNEHFGQSGNLYGFMSVEPSGPEDTLQQDLDLVYRYRVLSPVDSLAQLDGMGSDCNAYPGVPYPIVFTIEPPPRATNFTFNVFFLFLSRWQHRICSNRLRRDLP